MLRLCLPLHLRLRRKVGVNYFLNRSLGGTSQEPVTKSRRFVLHACWYCQSPGFILSSASARNGRFPVCEAPRVSRHRPPLLLHVLPTYALPTYAHDDGARASRSSQRCSFGRTTSSYCSNPTWKRYSKLLRASYII